MDSGYSLADIKALQDDDNDAFGGSWGWIILIFLFFFAFSGGNGLFGNHGTGTQVADLSYQTNRDVLTSSCETQKAVMQSQYDTLLGFKDQQMQIAKCCCDNQLAICNQTNELQTAIHREGEETRALINANTIQALRDDLNGANTTLANQVLANSIVNQVRPVPIPAYPTCSPYTAYTFCGCNNGTTF